MSVYTVERLTDRGWYPLAGGISDESEAYELFYSYTGERRIVKDNEWVIAHFKK